MKALLFLPLCGLLFLLPGCNTVKGVGQDISGSASYVQEKISGN